MNVGGEYERVNLRVCLFARAGCLWRMIEERGAFVAKGSKLRFFLRRLPGLLLHMRHKKAVTC